MSDPALAHFETLFGPEFGHGKALDLAPLRRALAKLDDPQDKLPPVVHVAGTNGKGSTIAFMRAILQASGLRAHAFTKPHILHLRERFVVAGETVDDQVLISAADDVARTREPLTQFDAQAAAAFLLFAEMPADIVLLEVGMGGRNDSTNVVARPAVTAITPISLDHQDVLGGSLAEIAAHKAGVTRRGVPTIVARQPDEARDVIEAEAKRVDALLQEQGVDWDAYAQAGGLALETRARSLHVPLPALMGAHQIDNAGLAAVALLSLERTEIDARAIGEGVAGARLSGRMQALTHGRLAGAARAHDAEIWVDGGHNAQAAAALAQMLSLLQRKRPVKTALIVGLRARKDWAAFAKRLAGSAAIVIAVPVADGGATPESVAAAFGAEARTANSIDNALSRALDEGAQRVLICGSFALVAEALSDIGVA
ncbi:MAG TPA: Mur ligase family protein [Caulobacterales bacterium]|nr:Mur ligase family protein [Caulobacterales bacterium]